MQNRGILSLNFVPYPQNTKRKMAQLPNLPLDKILRICVIIPSFVQKLYGIFKNLCVRIIILRSAFSAKSSKCQTGRNHSTSSGPNSRSSEQLVKGKFGKWVS